MSTPTQPCASCGRPSVATRPWRAPQPECRDCREVRRGKAPHIARVPERVVQQQIVHLLRSLGAQVWVLGTTRRRGDYHGTMMSPGLPDLIASVRGHMLMVECKAAGGRLRPEQRVFQQACQDCGVAHVVGGVDEVVAWLVAQGILRADAVAHYRRPAESANAPAQRSRTATQAPDPRSEAADSRTSPSVSRRAVRIEVGQ